MRITRRGAIRGMAGAGIAGVAARVSGDEEEAKTEEWPTARYDARNTGYAPGNTGPLSEIEEEWRVTMPEKGSVGPGGTSWPVVADGSVYVGDSNGTVHAFDRESGDREWKSNTEDFIRTTPTVADGVVYVGGGDGKLHALDADTGDRKWRFGAPGMFASPPTVAGDTVYVGIEGKVYAVDRESGGERWVARHGNSTRSPPAVADDFVYVGGGNKVHALDRTTGNVVWTGLVRLGRSSVAVVRDTVYASAGSILSAYDSATGNQKWQKWRQDMLDSWRVGSPAVANGTVFVTGSEGKLYALDRSSGEPRWSANMPNEKRVPPSVTDNAVYLGGNPKQDGGASIYAFDRETSEQLWSYDTGGRVYMTPVIVDGTIYVRDRAGNLVALSGSTERSTPTPTPAPTPTPDSTSTPTPTPTPDREETPYPPDDGPISDDGGPSSPIPDDGPIRYDGEGGGDDPDSPDSTRFVVQVVAGTILVGATGEWLYSRYLSDDEESRDDRDGGLRVELPWWSPIDGDDTEEEDPDGSGENDSGDRE